MHPDTAEGREAYKRDFWKSLEDDWKEAAEEGDHPWLNEFSSSYEPFKNYEFREENPLAETSNPLEEGKQRLEAVRFTLIHCHHQSLHHDENNLDFHHHNHYNEPHYQGDLPSAVLLFEAAARQDPDSAEVWQLLGKCHRSTITMMRMMRRMVMVLVCPSFYQSATCDTAVQRCAALLGFTGTRTPCRTCSLGRLRT